MLTLRIVAFCITLGALSFWSSWSFGHDDWISRLLLVDPISKEWCCNKNDCEPMRMGAVKESFGVFVIDETSEYIDKARVIWRSPDGGWWRCRYGLGHIRAGKTRCIIGPPRGS